MEERPRYYIVEHEEFDEHRHPQSHIWLTALIAYSAEDALTCVRVNWVEKAWPSSMKSFFREFARQRHRRIVGVRAPTSGDDHDLVEAHKEHAEHCPNGYTVDATHRKLTKNYTENAPEGTT
jgi:hypothetical protein